MNFCPLTTVSRKALYTLGLGVLVFLIFALTSGCRKKYDPDKFASGSWDPNLAVPIAYSNFGVHDILDRAEAEDLFVIDPESGLLALVYTGEAFSFAANEVLQLAPQNFSASFTASDFNFPILPSFNEQAEGSVDETFSFAAPNGEELYSIELSSGLLTLSAETSVQHPIELTFSFPYITQFGVPLEITLPIPPASSASVDVDLADYLLDFTGGGGDPNTISAEITASISGNGNPINGNENISASIGISNLQFAIATGDFGQQSVGADGDSILIAIFQNAEQGYFELTNPRLMLDITNSFGFPTEVDITTLETVDTDNGQTYPMTGYPNPVLIGHPNTPGDSVLTTLVFDAENTSNISNIITPVPKYLNFEFQGTSNPAGQAAIPNFITGDSRLKINARLELPLEGFAYGFVVRDTIEFDFAETVEEVEWVKIRINALNGFPVDLSSQVYLADADFNIIDTLLTSNDQVLQSGQVNAIGRVVTPTQKITDVLIPRDRIDMLYDAAHLIIVAESNTLNGSSGEIIGLYDDNFIELRLGLQVQARLTY